MAFSGEDSQIRMSGNLSYTPLEDLDNHHTHVQQEDKPLPLPPQNSHQPERLTEQPPSVTPNPCHRSKPINIKPPSLAPASRTIYRECLKNHAASIGGNVTDGCGEFMPSGEHGTLEALKCAACNCHRNFHRRETTQQGGENNPLLLHNHHVHQIPPSLTSLSLNNRNTSSDACHGGHHQWTTISAQPVKMGNFGGGSGSVATDSSSEELNFNAYQSSAVVPPPYVLSKKRYRTKFTQEQKEKMLEFAEKLGWRIPREDDSEVQRFCAEVGVKRQVFKVWMHNNKSSSSSKNNNAQEPLNMITS